MGQKNGRAARPPPPAPRRQPLNLPKPTTRTARDRKASYYPALAEDQSALPMRHRNPLTDAASAGDLDSVLSILVMRDFDVNILSEAGETALHLATRRQDSHMIEALLARGAAPNALDGNGFTPLHHLVCNADTIVTPWSTGRPVGTTTEIILMLVRYGADVNATSFDGVSVLHEALRNKKLVEANVLMQKGAHFESMSSSGDTPLHEACRCNDTILVDSIIKSKFYTLQIPKQYWVHWGIPLSGGGGEQLRRSQSMELTHPTPVLDYVTHLRRGPPIKRQGPPPTLCTAVPLYFLRAELVVSLVDRTNDRSYEKILRQMGVLPPQHQQLQLVTAAATASQRAKFITALVPTPGAGAGATPPRGGSAPLRASLRAGATSLISPPAAFGQLPTAAPPVGQAVLTARRSQTAQQHHTTSSPRSIDFDMLMTLFDHNNEYSNTSASLGLDSRSRDTPRDTSYEDEKGTTSTATSTATPTTRLAPSVVHIQSSSSTSPPPPSASSVGGPSSSRRGRADVLSDGTRDGDGGDDGPNDEDDESDDGMRVRAPRYVMPSYGRLKRGIGCSLDLAGKDGKTPLGCCDGWQGDKKLILMLLVARTTMLLTDEILL